jgi:hypothetical protein
MPKLTIALVLVLFSTAVAAYAETYNYSCKVNGKTYPLRVDDVKNTLEWRGVKYGISNAHDPDKDEIVCAKAGWHADGNGTSFDFCTATKGYADIEKDGNVEAECDLKRR